MKRSMLLVGLLVLLLPSVSAQEYVQTGEASYYADKFEGRLTASGEKYRHSKLTAAHRTLPFGTLVEVKNLSNQKSVEVKINDRGPFVEGRIIDLSRSAAESLDFINQGIVEVEIRVIHAGDGKNNNYASTISTSYEPIDEKEFYAFSVDRVYPSGGYGVQIGSFQEMANLVRLAQNLKSSYKKKVTVQVSVVNNNKIYKIIVGQEKSREKAESLRRKLMTRYPDCFVYEFSFNK